MSEEISRPIREVLKMVEAIARRKTGDSQGTQAIRTEVEDGESIGGAPAAPAEHITPAPDTDDTDTEQEVTVSDTDDTEQEVTVSDTEDTEDDTPATPGTDEDTEDDTPATVAVVVDDTYDDPDDNGMTRIEDEPGPNAMAGNKSSRVSSSMATMDDIVNSEPPKKVVESADIYERERDTALALASAYTETLLAKRFSREWVDSIARLAGEYERTQLHENRFGLDLFPGSAAEILKAEALHGAVAAQVETQLRSPVMGIGSKEKGRPYGRLDPSKAGQLILPSDMRIFTRRTTPSKHSVKVFILLDGSASMSYRYHDEYGDSHSRMRAAQSVSSILCCALRRHGADTDVFVYDCGRDSRYIGELGVAKVNGASLVKVTDDSSDFVRPSFVSSGNTPSIGAMSMCIAQMVNDPSEKKLILHITDGEYMPQYPGAGADATELNDGYKLLGDMEAKGYSAARSVGVHFCRSMMMIGIEMAAAEYGVRILNLRVSDDVADAPSFLSSHLPGTSIYTSKLSDAIPLAINGYNRMVMGS